MAAKKKKKTNARKRATPTHKKWWSLGGHASASEPLLQVVPLDLVKAEIARHRKKGFPLHRGGYSDLSYAGMPWHVVVHPSDEFHAEAYRRSKDPAFLPAIHADLGTFHDALGALL